MNGIYKMSESSSNAPRNDLENDIIEIPSSFDIQSSTDTNIDSSSIVSKPFFSQSSHLLMYRSNDVKEK